MTKISIKYIVLAALITATSCKKLVEIPDPIDTVTDLKIFNSDEQATQTISGLYSQMLGFRTDEMTFGFATIYGGLASDEILMTNETGAPDEYEFSRNNILPQNLMSESRLWISAYKIIYSANAILDGERASPSAKLTTKKREELKGNAKFVRAFCLFYLAGFYGNIPLTLSSKFNENIKISKSTADQVYDQMILDLKESIAHFQNSGIAPTKSKANQYSAEALLARAYLYKRNWESARLHATNVINSGQYNLSTLETTFNKNSSEAILQLSVIAAVEKSTFDDTRYLSPTMPLYALPPLERAMYLDPSFYPIIESYCIPLMKLSDQLVGAFETGDRRAAVWANYNDSPNIAPWNGVKTYFANKYPLDNSKNTSYMFIRLAEMYLIRAEAQAMLDQLDLAKQDVDKIRDRADLDASPANSKEAVLAAIAKERQTELFLEWGHRFFDLKRTGKAIEVLSQIPIKSGLTLNRLDFPIPQTEIARNPRLTQNPGY